MHVIRNGIRISTGGGENPVSLTLRNAAETARLLETLEDAERYSYTALKDTPPGVHILVPATLNRKDKTQVLPENYTDYNTLRITTFNGRGNQEVTQDIATALLSAIATLTNYGANANHSFGWARSTRTITYTPSQNVNNSGIIYCDLHS